MEILNWVSNNLEEFQLTNSAHKQFREYIYNSKGDYLIGGEKRRCCKLQRLSWFTVMFCLLSLLGLI